MNKLLLTIIAAVTVAATTHAARTNYFDAAPTVLSNVVFKPGSLITINGETRSNWPTIGVATFAENALNATNWTGWASASNALLSVFQPIGVGSGTNTLAEVLTAGNNAGGLSITSVGSVGGSPGADLSLTAADGGEGDEPNPGSVVIGAGGGNALDGSVTVKAGQNTPWSAYLTLGARTNFTYGGHVVLQAGSDATSLFGAKLKLYGAGSGTGQIELTAADGVAADIVLTPGVAGDATGAVNIARGQLKLGDTTVQKTGTSNITVNLPGNSGTLALTADLAGYLATGSVSYVDSLGVTNPVTTGTVIVGGDANALTNVTVTAPLQVTISNRSAVLSAPGVITNNGTATLNTLTANTGTITSLHIGTGGLVVNGTATYATVIYSNTVIYGGTNFVASNLYTTQNVYEVTIRELATNVTTTTGEMRFDNSFLNATNASKVFTPHLQDTKGGSAVATGTWDFSGATVSGLGTSSITTGDVQGIISAYGAVTNSGSNVSGLTLTTSGGIVTLGGSIPPSGDALTTNQVNGLIASGITGKAETNITTTAPSGTGSLIYSNSQFYFTPPSAAGLGSVTNVNITVTTTGGLTVDGGTSKVWTNGGSYTLAQAGVVIPIALLPGSALTFGSTNNATIVGTSNGHSASNNWDSLEFSPTTDQSASWQVVNHNASGMTNVTLWTVTPTGGANTNVWSFGYAETTTNAVMPSAWTVLLVWTNQVQAVTNGVAQFGGSFTNIIPVGPVWFNLRREATSAADNNATNAYFIGGRVW